MALKVAGEAVEHGYSSSRIVERLRELGIERMTQSDAHPYALNLANMLCEREDALKALRDFASYVAARPEPDLGQADDAALKALGELSWRDRMARTEYETRAAQALEACELHNEFPAELGVVSEGEQTTLTIGTKDGMVALQSAGNSEVEPNYILWTPEQAREVATQLLRLADSIGAA